MANLTKDQRLIKENPGKSPYELKEMGLSDKGFTDLLAEQGAEGKKQEATKPPEDQNKPTVTQLQDIENKLTDAIVAPVPAKLTIIPSRATPHTQAAKPMHVAEGQGILIEKKSGKRTQMSKAAAERWARKHPGKFDVV